VTEGVVDALDLQGPLQAGQPDAKQAGGLPGAGGRVGDAVHHALHVAADALGLVAARCSDVRAVQSLHVRVAQARLRSDLRLKPRAEPATVARLVFDEDGEGQRVRADIVQAHPGEHQAQQHNGSILGFGVSHRPPVGHGGAAIALSPSAAPKRTDALHTGSSHRLFTPALHTGCGLAKRPRVKKFTASRGRDSS
jgi:hypothetical protein